MAVTQGELDSFHRFATDRLRESEEEFTIDDLVIEWDSCAIASKSTLPYAKA